MSVEFVSVRAATATSLLAILWIIEGAWPMFVGRSHRGAHYIRNVTLGLTNAAVVTLILSSGLLFATEYAQRAEFGLIQWIPLPQAAAWLVAIVAIDAWQYLWHVANHKLPILWRFHAVHHSDAEMDASTAVRFHTGEIILSALARMIVLPLLGLTMVHLAVYEIILLPIVMFHHSNIRVPDRLDRGLRTLIVTPWMHWVHHSDEQVETDSNYASIFSFWDRVFGTFRIRREPDSIILGLKGFQAHEWQTIRGIFLTPFRHKRR